MSNPSPIQNLRRRIGRAIAYLTSGWRRKALVVLFVLLSVAVIARIIIGNWELLTEYDWDFQPSWFLIALGFFLVDFLLSLWAWHLLVARLAGYRNARSSARIYLQSNLARRIPGTVWYVASRAVLYEEQGVSKRSISLLSGLELLLFMISGVLTTLLTLPFWSLPEEFLDLPDSPLWLLAVIPLGAAVVHPRVLNAIWRRLSREKPEEHLRWRDTASWVILYIIIWILGGLVLFAVLNAFQTTPLARLIHVIGIWALANTISLVGVVTISLIGLREISLTLLLSALLPTPVALIVAITIRLIWLTGELLTSLLSLRL